MGRVGEGQRGCVALSRCVGEGQAGRKELASSAVRVQARSCSNWHEEDDRRLQVG